MRRSATRAAWTSLAVAWLVAGCATFGDVPATITVAKKDSRTRWDSTVVGYRHSAATGHVEEVRREELVDEYWLKSAEGKWYRVSRADWDRARVGASIDLGAGPGLSDLRRPIGPCTTGAGAVWPCP